MIEDAAAQTDERLLEQSRQGCEQSFAALYRRHQGRVYRFALQMSGSAASAEDAVQETFLVLLDATSSFDSRRGSFVPFLMGVARNRVLRHLRGQSALVPLDSEKEGEEASVPEDLLSDLTRREAIEWVRQAVLSLPPAYREVVVLCDLQEMDYAGAAGALGCSVGTVRSRLHRGRALLQRKMAGARKPRWSGEWSLA